MKAKVKFIDKSKYSTCWGCNGVGTVISKRRTKNKEIIGKKCKICNGSGEFRESDFMLIYTDKKGKKQAFCVDRIK